MYADVSHVRPTMAHPLRLSTMARDAHPGVRLYEETLPSGRVRHIAKYRCPASGKRRTETLDGLQLRTPIARRNWAKAKSDYLAELRRAISLGLPPPADPTAEPADGKGSQPAGAPLTLEDGRDRFLEAIGDRRPRTIQQYREVVRMALPLFREAGAARLEEITPSVLAYVRAKIIGRPVAAATHAHRITHIRGWLSRLRKLGLVALSSDQISEALERPRVDRRRPQFLRPDECQQLLQAALRRDAARAWRHRIAPFIVGTLLSGCRLGEARGLQWRDVDLEAQLMAVDPTASKSRIERLIDLSISPGLCELLAARQRRTGHRPFVWQGAQAVPPTSPKNWIAYVTGAPAWNWQRLRQTASTYVAAIAGPLAEAQRHGHSIAVSERHYLGSVRVPRDVATLERALGIEEIVAAIAAAQ